MADYQKNYPKGSYRLRIKENTTGTANTGSDFIMLQCEVLSGKTTDKNVIWGGTRTVRLWLTDKALPNTIAFVKAAGFNGSIVQLDIEHPDHYSLEGFEFNASNEHNENAGKKYDNFSAYPVKAKFGSNLNKINTSRLLQLDALFGCNTIQAPVKKAVVERNVIGKIENKPVQVQTEPGQDFEEDSLPF
jgi:hypothetical protein